MVDSVANDNSTCVVCFKTVLYSSVGECEHPVCYECSTRMRVLCQQNECPICRQDLARVVFSDSNQPYKELRNIVFNDNLFERTYKIAFCNEQIKDAYEKLLENQCKLCDSLPPFRSFEALNDHMKKAHERFFCELCVVNLKIFTNERKCYTRQDLAYHRRKGDLDDTSHKGHPLCQFCEDRFMDPDDLYRHLRKEHMYCHLCDADGRNQYYSSHATLAKHFRTEHYLCEDGECADQFLTSVFRSEIDLKGHKAMVHGRGMARAASRQARTLELQFNITPHPRPHSSMDVSPPLAPSGPPVPRIDTESVEQFPSLTTNGAAAPSLLAAPTGSRNYKGADSLARNDRNFPALDGAPRAAPAPAPRPNNAANASTVLRNSKPSVSIQVHSQPASASSFRLTQAGGNRISSMPQHNMPLDEDDFPSLSIPKDDYPSLGASSLQPSKISLISKEVQSQPKNKNPNYGLKSPPLNLEAFPALSSSSAAPTAAPQWITVSKDKSRPRRQHNPAPAPAPAPPAPADFPILPANKKNNKKQPHAAPEPPKAANPNKEKKKQNSTGKKETFMEYEHMNGAADSYSSTWSAESKVRSVEPAPAPPAASLVDKKHTKFSIKPGDYPPLCGSSPAPLPVAPAGFASRVAAKPLPAPAPAPAAPACMTFTNSAGQTFPATPHDYIPPPNFAVRNSRLVKRFTEALGASEALEGFKVASRAFRDGALSADDFYGACQTVLGDCLDDEFPELVALLPDIGKQQELVRGREARLVVCKVCGQLCTMADAAVHDTAHWPPLGKPNHVR